MALIPGTRLGVYEVTAQIGEGGMGQVFRGRDTRLNRDVALKVLPDSFAHDAERLARFTREAQTLASLNHPNIAHLHGLEESGGVTALVMELVEGEDLSAHILRGPMPFGEVLLIARQIADALEAAHEQGIIHRDLKPANIKIKTDGTAKVLDFGLAKAMDPVDPSSATAMNSPTLSMHATQAGVILGTAAYMAPEQARGKPVDRRADIWAFGCVVYEMLTGVRPFTGDDTSLTLAAVLKEKVDFSALPPDTPVPVVRLLRRCLEKDPRKRLSAIGDARLELDEAADDTASGRLPSAVPPVTPAWRTHLMWGAAGALVAAVAMGAVLAPRSRLVDTRPVVRSQIAFSGTPLLLLTERALALAPDGTALVFSSARPNEPSRLYRRSLADETITPMPGTEGATAPFFSPDGRWLFFNQDRRLKKMSAEGGALIDYREFTSHQGGSYGVDGTLVLNTGHGEGLTRVRPGSTTPEVLTTVDRAAGEAGHHWPHILPDGKHALYTVEIDGKPYSDARIMLLSLETGQSQLLINGGSDARYIPTGHIVYWRLGDLWSVPFDVSSRRLGESAVAIVRNVMLGEANGNAHFTVADDGTMAYLPGGDPMGERSVVLVDRRGAARVVTTERKAYQSLNVSPDGARLAMTLVAANDSLWTLELDRGALTRITFEAENAGAVWSPDGKRLAFTRHFGGEPQQLYQAAANGGAAPQLLRRSDRTETVDSWSRKGNTLAFTRAEDATGADIWVMPAETDGKASPWLVTRFYESQAQFSPDGRWIAYVSDESGRFETYVNSYPDAAHKRQVSFDGGVEPRWRADGRELFYRRDDAVLAAAVTAAGGELRFSVPTVLFKREYLIVNSRFGGTWDALPDGQRFVFIQNFAEPRTAVTLVQNWFSELRK